MTAAVWQALRQRKRWLWLRYQYWREYTHSGEWELLELGKYVDRSKIAVDIGGNIGTYSYHLHRLARGVVTFEPNPEYIALIEDVKLRRCQVHSIALSSTSGVDRLKIPLAGNGREDRGMASIQPGVVAPDMESRSLDVEKKCLDDFHFGNVGFIKIDVEGHEEHVMHGAIDTIARNKPNLLIEIEERHNKGGLQRIAGRLATLRYEGYYFANGRRQPLASFDLSRMQTEAPATQGGQHNRRKSSYVNNFLFLPETVAAHGSRT